MKTTRRRRRWWPWFVGLPLIVLAVLLLGLLYKERQATVAVEAELQRLGEAGMPYDDASMASWYRQRSSPEGAAAWNEIMRLVDTPNSMFVDWERLPIIGNAELPEPLLPEVPWPEEPLVAEYLRVMHPVIERIDAARVHPTPVWLPIEFEGFETLLPDIQSSRSVIRLLNLEATHALYHRDAMRALRALECMRGATDAFASELCLVGELVTIALSGVLHDTIRQSLEIDLWQDEHLQQLDALLAPRDIRLRWQRSIAGERAMALTTLTPQRAAVLTEHSEVAGQLFRFKSLWVPLLDAYRETESLADDPSRLRARSKDFEARLNLQMSGSLILSVRHVLVGLMMPAINAMAAAVERDENSRRLTRTAIAAMRFQLQHQRWPQDLSELSQVGLQPDHWRTLSGGPLGFEAQDDQCYVWSYDVLEQDRVPAERPQASDETTRWSAPLVRIPASTAESS